MDSKTSNDATERLNAMVSQVPEKSWQEMVITRLASLGVYVNDCLELHVSGKGIDLELPQRAIDAFFTAFFLYPTSIAVHSTVAALLGANETILKAECRFVSDNIIACAHVLGKDFKANPIRIEANDDLDLKTVAVRFKINFDDYEEAALSVLKNMMNED